MKRSLLVFVPLLFALGCDKPIGPTAAPPSKDIDQKLAPETLIKEDQTVKLTGANTKVTFVGTKPGGKHNGGFKNVDGTIKMSSAGAKIEGTAPPIASITVEFDADSLYTDTDKLTNHLKSPDFFDAKQFPKASFTSTKIESVAGKDGEMSIAGELTLHGVKKPVAFSGSYTNKSGSLTLTSTFKIKWTEYGMAYARGGIDPDVTVTVEVGKPAK